MRMAANIEVWLLFLKDILHLRHIVSWIATDVGHVDIDIFDMEKQVLRILHAHDVVVDVAMHGPQGLELCQGIRRLDVAQITCMPQLVNILEEVEKLWDEGAMRIR